MHAYCVCFRYNKCLSEGLKKSVCRADGGIHLKTDLAALLHSLCLSQRHEMGVR